MARFGSGTHRNTQAIGIPRNFDLVVLRPAPDNFIFLVLVDFQWIWVAFLHADMPLSFKLQFLARFGPFGSRKVKYRCYILYIILKYAIFILKA